MYKILAKTEQKEPEQTDSEYAHFGILFEPVARKEFTERTGMRLFLKKEGETNLCILMEGEI